MNIQGLLKQAQQMQASVNKVEKDLAGCQYKGTSGGDSVSVTINGGYEVVEVDIKEELLEKKSREMLQDMIMLAVNNAMATAKKDRDEKMDAVTQGVKLPGLF